MRTAKSGWSRWRRRVSTESRPARLAQRLQDVRDHAHVVVLEHARAGAPGWPRRRRWRGRWPGPRARTRRGRDRGWPGRARSPRAPCGPGPAGRRRAPRARGCPTSAITRSRRPRSGGRTESAFSASTRSALDGARRSAETATARPRASPRSADRAHGVDDDGLVAIAQQGQQRVQVRRVLERAQPPRAVGARERIGGGRRRPGAPGAGPRSPAAWPSRSPPTSRSAACPRRGGRPARRARP